MVVCGLAAVLLLVAVSPHLEGESDLATTLYFPDYVDGEGWSVQLALLNVDPTAAAAVVVTAYDQEGQPGPELFDSEAAFEIPSRGSRVLRSAGGGSIRRGWIQVQSQAASVRGLLTYRHGKTGIEVGVEPVPLRDHFALFVEESGGIGTGLAIFKPDAAPEIEFQIRNQAGLDPIGEVLSWGNFQQRAQTIPEWFERVNPEILKDFQGLLYLRAADGSSFAPLGLRFGKRRGSLSAVPAIPILDARPPTVSLSASPASIEWGRSATLRWSSTGAVSATLTPGIGAVATSGSHSVSPTRTTTYRVTVRGGGGQTQTAMASAKVTVVISELAALMALYEATGGSSWTSGENWLTGPLGEWHGVEVDDHGRVTSLGLGGNLTGPIPAELGSLANLWWLDLSNNALTGAIPAQLGSLANLERLNLYGNGLTGIPAQLGGLESLRTMALSRNARMSGALPDRLTDLHQLEVLQAGDTGLCAPSDARFRDWLAGVWKRRVALCADGDPPSAYLTQAVQSREFPVPLVAGEDALLRVFVTATRATGESLPPVRATFYRNGTQTHVVGISGKSAAIPNEVTEGDLAASVNAEIPGRVVQPGLEMVIDIDLQGTLGSSPDVTKRIPKSGRLAIDVRAMPVFDLTVIPFLWSPSPDSSVLELVRGMAEDPEGHSLLGDTRTLLPIGEMDVKAHASVLSSTNNAYDLLRETKAIRAMEGASGHYMGMMAGGITGGAAGVAYQFGRVNFSTANASTIAHELGHNLSLGHAPCGGPAWVGSFFPTTNGSIGAWGYDFRGNGRLVPPNRRDLMSYCHPKWISDYHFTNALGFRLRTAATGGLSSLASAPARALLLWGGVDASGAPFLEPAFVVDAPASLPRSTGEHEIIGRTGGGGELFSLSFSMPEVADGDGRSSFAFILPAQPEWSDRLASITLSGPGGVVTLDKGTDRPVTLLLNPRTGEIRGILRDVTPPAALTRGNAAAALSLDPGVEMLTSRGIPELEDWRRWERDRQ